MTNINFNASSTWIHDKIFWNEDLWERKHMLDATKRTRHTLDVQYEKSDQSKVASEIKHLI